MPASSKRGIVKKRDVTPTAVAVEQLNKHVSAETNIRNKRAVFSVRCVPRGYKKEKKEVRFHPCPGGVKYLHRDPATRRSLKYETVKYGCESQGTRTRERLRCSIYRRQTRPLVREGAPQKQDHTCHTVINIWSWAQMGLDTKTYWLTVNRNVTLTFDLFKSVEFRDSSLPGYELESRGIELRNWGIRTIYSSSVKLKVWLSREDFTCNMVPRYLGCVIQWDCHSSFVRMCCQETVNGGCKGLRTLVLHYWTVKCGDQR
jgi:hypothetical protein